MNDGLYQVNWRNICAGFVVKHGRVIVCAPILKRRISFFQTVAKLICNESKVNEH
jgi:hypothetical protein